MILIDTNSIISSINLNICESQIYIYKWNVNIWINNMNWNDLVKYFLAEKSDTLRFRCMKNSNYCIMIVIIINLFSFHLVFSEHNILKNLTVCLSYLNLSINLKNIKILMFNSNRTKMYSISCARRNFATGRFRNQSYKFWTLLLCFRKYALTKRLLEACINM